jgi:hypothetical protein
MQAEKPFAKTYADDWDEAPPPRVEPEAETDLAPAQSPAPAPKASPCPAAPQPAAPAVSPAAAKAAIPIPHAWELDRFPGLFARSALFQARRGGPRVEKKPLECYGREYGAVYEGPILDMREKRIWELVLREAKKTGGADVEFAMSANELAIALGPRAKAPGVKPPKPSGPELARVGESLRRLAQAEIEYALPGGASGKGKLLGSARESASGWSLSIDSGLIPLLRDDNQFRIDTARRDKLKKELSKWLHDFVSTHDEGFEKGFELAKLAKLSGLSGDGDKLRRFVPRLREALKELSGSCPALVAGFELPEGARVGKDWRAVIKRGPDKVSFLCPAKEALKAAEKARGKAARSAASKGKKPAAKGGPAL